MDALEQEIVSDLAEELEVADTAFSPNLLAVKVRGAIREVRMRRNYVATSMSEAQIQEDLRNYYSTIRNLALYDYSQAGAPFESSHSENSTSRTWTSRDDLLKGVHAFVKLL